MSFKNAILLVLLLAAAAAFAIVFGDAFSLDALKSRQQEFKAIYEQRPVAVFAMFFGLYVAVAALAVPGAAVLTLAAGALFGLGRGTLLVSFASSIGALLAFLASRYLLRDAVRDRFDDRIAAIDRGMKRDGALYLFTLRLVPLFPFFAINVAMGLTAMRASRFYWVSQVGMIPATVVYVNAGSQLARIESLGAIVSPALLGSFALLATLPWLGRALTSWVQRRRLHARWRHARPRTFDRNLIVIGGGAAGLVSAYIAAAAKASVTLVEANKMGGDCLNYGCVPSKALIRSATVAHQMRQASRYGLNDTEPQIRIKDVMRRVRSVIAQIEPHDSTERFSSLGVDVARGYARIVSPWTVEIDLAGGGKRRLTTRSIVIAAGAEPAIPDLPGLEGIGYLTSDTLWDAMSALERAPKRLLILGGGAIGCELAQAFARLGVSVTVVEAAPRLLAREDDEVSVAARLALEESGVRVLIGCKALRCERDSDDKTLVVESNGLEVHLAFDELICAIGRRARLTGYGLEELGIATNRTVETNEYLQALFPNVFAAGDVAGPYQFTHTASHQAWYATINALFGDLHRFRPDYSAVPMAIFIDPEIARVGLNELEAKAQGIPFELTRYNLENLDRAITDSERLGFVKVLTTQRKDRILGVTIVGAHASELIAEFALAMRNGLGLSKILRTIHAYPTFAEANKYAAGQWRQARQPAWTMRLLHAYHLAKRAGWRAVIRRPSIHGAGIP